MEFSEICGGSSGICPFRGGKCSGCIQNGGPSVCRKEEGRKRREKESKVLYVVLGLLIALLLLCFILPLLASADPVFGDLIDRIFNLIFIQIAVPENLISILLMFCWGVLFSLPLSLRYSRER